MASANNKLKTGTNAIIFTGLILLSLVAVNLIGTRVFGRLDLTQDKIYTLSPASRELVKSLPDPIIAKAYISSKDVPPQVGQISRYLRDILDEYKAASGGKFQWEAIDPSGDPAKESEAASAGVRKLQLQQLSKEKVSIGSLYLGVAFEYGDKTERLPQVGGLEGLEYEISSIIKRLTQKKRKIGFVAGQGEETQQTIGYVWSALAQNYDVTSVTLGATPAKIPDDVDALIVIGPKQGYSDAAKRALDEYLMQGKSIAFFVDGMRMEQPRGQMPPGMQMPKMARKNDVALESLLGAYGFRVEDDIVMDEQNARAPAMTQQGQMVLVNQPYFPIVDERGMGKHLSLIHI
jgi:gliding-associated putative ABC transporter substrate-binding component GldG